MASNPNAGQEGRPVMPELDAFGTNAPDYSDDIFNAFGFSDDSGPKAGTSERGGETGGAPPSSPSSAAEGSEEALKPELPPTPQHNQGTDASQSQVPTTPPAPVAVPAPAPAAPTEAPASAELQSLKAQVQALTQMLTQQQAQAQQPQAAPQAQERTGVDTQPQEELANYNLAIPADVASAIFSDDASQATAGLQHLINSFGKIVHGRVVQQVNQIVEERLQNYGVQQEQGAEQRRMQDEYYGQFKDHNDPGIRLIVAQEAQTMWAQNPQLPWDSNAINALGQRVNSRLGRPIVQAQQYVPPAQQAAAPTPAPRPAAQMGASTRSPQGNQADGDFMYDILTH